MKDICILSIHYGHNATVGLSINGEIISLISEERINRIKNATGFPFQALQITLDTFLDGDSKKIDKIVLNDATLLGYQYIKNINFTPTTFLDYHNNTRKSDINNIIDRKIQETISSGRTISLPLGLIKKVDKIKNYVKKSFDDYKKDTKLIEKECKEKLSEILNYNVEDKVVFLNHHLAHAYSGLYFVDNKEKYLLFTLDGEGDLLSSTVNIWDGNKLQTISKNSRELSLGYLYQEVTAYLGMKPTEHEYKVMGMSPYANEERAKRVKNYFEELLFLDEKDGTFSSKYNLMDLSEFLITNLIYERFDNVAGGLQAFTEDIICQWINYWCEKTGIRSILLSGGVFMNVKAAKTVMELPSVEKLFVVPSAGDESLVIGGCWWGFNQMSKNNVKLIKDLYLGRYFDNEYIAHVLENPTIAERYTITKLSDIELAQRVGKLLAQNNVVARCDGREEWGARALGNRSIMCNPSNFHNINILNKAIKKRDFWMPFTPSILAEDIGLYVINPKKINDNYMCVAFDSTPLAQKHIIAALHPQDYTVRPQAVRKDWNEGYYRIIEAFKENTGISGILNTSFNLHGEPNVSTPEDAIRTVDNSGIEYLVLGNYLLEKK